MKRHFYQYYLVGYWICMSFCVNAQGLKVGDKVRDVQMEHVLNYKNDKARLSEFAGKPMLIHFWNTHCPVSLEALAKLKQIQQAYGNALNIVTVTFEKREKVEQLMEGLPYAKELNFAMVIRDTLLRQLFPHKVQPHEVWINSDGVVKAISSDDYLTTEKVKAFLTKDTFSLPVKSEPMDLDNIMRLDIPMLTTLLPKHKDLMRQYSFFSQAIDGASGGTSTPGVKNGWIHLKATNVSAYTLYSMAYRQISMHRSRIIFKDPERYRVPYKSYENSFCYELMKQTSSEQAAYEQIIRDLDGFFGLHSRLEKRLIKCFVLRRTAINDKLSERKGKSYYTDTSRVIPSIQMKVFIENTLYTLPLYVVDETGIKGRIGIEVPKHNDDVDALKRMLAKYDLSLTEEERELEVIALD
jgi:thiol-disulfide isomerase/thioredoxin